MCSRSRRGSLFRELKTSSGTSRSPSKPSLSLFRKSYWWKGSPCIKICRRCARSMATSRDDPVRGPASTTSRLQPVTISGSAAMLSSGWISLEGARRHTRSYQMLGLRFEGLCCSEKASAHCLRRAHLHVSSSSWECETKASTSPKLATRRAVHSEATVCCFLDSLVVQSRVQQ